MDPFKSMVRYILVILVLGLLLSSLTMLPQVYHSFILFFSVSLPNIISMAVAPKWLFIVSNLIVIFLFGESKLGKGTEKNMYNYMTMRENVEYYEVAERGKVLLHENTNVGIQENKEMEVVAEVVEEKEVVEVAEREETCEQEDGEGERVCEEMETRDIEDEMESIHEELEREEEEMEEWPAEELNKKVEDFIAKVNMQIRLEARMAISCC